MASGSATISSKQPPLCEVDVNTFMLKGDFLQSCGTIKMNGVNHNLVKLNLFPFSLRDKARNWFNNLISGSIDT